MREEKFDKFYRENFNKLYVFFTLRVGTIFAVDLAQETFLKVYKTKKYSLPYLFVTAGNVLSNYLKKQHGVTISSSSALFLEPIKAEYFLENEVDEKVFFFKLKEALSSYEQSILELRFMNDLTFKEIAQTIGKTQGAVKMTFFRAIKKVKELGLT